MSTQGDDDYYDSGAFLADSDYQPASRGVGCLSRSLLGVITIAYGASLLGLLRAVDVAAGSPR